MADNTLSSQVYISRDQIRTQITASIKDYLELGNVDLTKSSFLSFVVNTMSTLTSNLFFYNVSTYREFFLTTAQLPESIYNLSSFLGYTPSKASYATAYILMSVPMGFYDPGSSTVTFRIPNGFSFLGGDTEFVTYYETVVSITDNTYVSAKMILEDGRELDIPVYIDTTSDPVMFYFTLAAKQITSSSQQLQIQSDLQPYVFTSVDLTFEDQLSSLTVAVGDESNLYTEYPSIYLIPTGEKGYVSEKRTFGRRIYFGNGFIGVQPPAGSRVFVSYTTTKGESGNVISGSITTAGRIYSELTSGEIRVVEYSCTNPSQASGGIDEESLENIRTNAIKNITSLSRFVSENDFSNINVIIPDSPFGDNSYPLLKRSDIRCNEIQLYTTLNFLDKTVPTKNIWYEVINSVVYIPKYTPLLFGTEMYYNIFDLTIDKNNGFAYYDYVVNNIILVPSLVKVYDPYYNSIVLQDLTITNIDSTKVEFVYAYTGSDTTSSCYFVIEETGSKYDMINDSTNSCFRYTFDPYFSYPEGNTTVLFTLNKDVYGLPVKVSDHTVNILVKKSLKLSMMSNVVTDSTSSNLIIYDIPTVSKIYYDNLESQQDFEYICIQPLVLSQYFENYRMLTDFINLKFADTTGVLTGMTLNKVNKRAVIDFIDAPPLYPSVGDRYIVDPESSYNSEMIAHRNWYMQCTGNILPGLATWEFIEPTSNDVVYMTNRDINYIYSGSQWINPIYTIPLNITIEIFKSPSYYGSDRDLIQSVKDTLISTFTSNFGINATLRRSELITCVQNITGVVYCHLVEPKTDIFFDFDINTFTRDELLRYSPEYVFFTDETINVKIIASY